MTTRDPRVGKTVAGKYKLKRLLGTGSMGTVYEGAHVEIGKRVAVKLMNAEFADSPEVVARFRREARAASAIESDYIVQVFDAGQDPELGVFMITELLTGEDLEAKLSREGRLDVTLATRIAYQIARGLAKAHAAGVVHRDLKPANVFLSVRDDDSLLAKILDFGISKVTLDDAPASRSVDMSITQAGIAIGTPQYMSPEQAQAQPIDARTDVWSLGAVLYEMLAGQPAISDRGSMFDIMVAVVREDVPQLTKVAPWVPAALAEVVHAALVKDREKRISDAATFAQRLRSVVPEAALGTSGRFSLIDIPMPTSTLESVPSPIAASSSAPRVDEEPRNAPTEETRNAPTEAPPSFDEEIPVSVAFESADTTPPPATLRDPSAALHTPHPPSEAPAPSSAEESVEVFQRAPGGPAPKKKPSRRPR